MPNRSSNPRLRCNIYTYIFRFCVTPIPKEEKACYIYRYIEEDRPHEESQTKIVQMERDRVNAVIFQMMKSSNDIFTN